MARSEYVYVLGSYPQGRPIAATTVKREIPILIEEHGRAVSVTIFKGGKSHRYIRPFELEEWLRS